MNASPAIKRALQASDLPADGAVMRDLGVLEVVEGLVFRGNLID